MEPIEGRRSLNEAGRKAVKLTAEHLTGLVDELLESAWATGRHLLRFWWGGPPAVVMGSNERSDQVVDAPACTRLGVEVLKRCTGGGTVLQTGGVLNYSLITPVPDHFDLKAGFRLGTDLICAILASVGIAGAPQGTSDVAVGDRKISGNAQARRWKSLLVHGTLLVDFDFELAERILRHPSREPEYRRGRGHRDFLITLSALGVRADRKAIENMALEAAERLCGPIKATSRGGWSTRFPEPQMILSRAYARAHRRLTWNHHDGAAGSLIRVSPDSISTSMPRAR